MSLHLKRLHQQVVVITGASSGIGLTTARMAAARGARVVLASRNEDALRDAVDEITGAGGHATFVTADVSDADAAERIARTALDQFGAIDTWVNNAGVSIYGKMSDVPLADMRRLFDVNFWGVVQGSQEAVSHLRDRGGAIINVGSVTSDLAIPLQGIYSASKHAVKGFTDALRLEIEKDRLPISVTLIKPASIDTMFIDHARSYMGAKPTLPSPVYPPQEVAQAILTAAQKPMRDVVVGGSGRVMSTLGLMFPHLSDWYSRTSMFSEQQDRSEPGDHRGSLYAPTKDGRETGSYKGRTMSSSAYTRARLTRARYVVPIAAGVAFAVLARLKS
jgi:short-subunit dehydrogenase